MAKVDLPYGFTRQTNSALDTQYLNGDISYISVLEVNTSIDESVRYIGLTVNINKVEYWYKDGVGDVNLVLKQQEGSFAIKDDIVSSGSTFSSQKLTDDFAKLKSDNIFATGTTHNFLGNIQKNGVDLTQRVYGVTDIKSISNFDISGFKIDTGGDFGKPIHIKFPVNYVEGTFTAYFTLNLWKNSADFESYRFKVVIYTQDVSGLTTYRKKSAIFLDSDGKPKPNIDIDFGLIDNNITLIFNENGWGDVNTEVDLTLTNILLTNIDATNAHADGFTWGNSIPVGFTSIEKTTIDLGISPSIDTFEGVLSDGGIDVNNIGTGVITLGIFSWRKLFSGTYNTYSTAVDTSFTGVTLASAGNQKFIGFYGTTSNTIIKVEGVESTAAVQPITPPNTVQLKLVLITDGGAYNENTGGIGFQHISGSPYDNIQLGNVLITKANDNNVLHLSGGTQTVLGPKTFATSPTFSSLTANRIATISATKQLESLLEVIAPVITNGTIISLLTNEANWNVNNVYTGTLLTNVNQMQFYSNANYFYYMIDDTTPIRIYRNFNNSNYLERNFNKMSTRTFDGNISYSATLSPIPASYVDLPLLLLSFNSVNGLAPTVNVNGLGAKFLRRNDGNYALAGDFNTTSKYLFAYNGTDYILVNGLPGNYLINQTATQQTASFWGQTGRLDIGLGLGIAPNAGSSLTVLANTASKAQLLLTPSATDYTGTVAGTIWNNAGELKFMDESIVNRLDKLYNNAAFVGVGNRMLEVNQYGDKSAVNPIIEDWVYDRNIISAITGSTYNQYGVANISVPGKTLYQSQKFYDYSSNTLYEAIDDNKILKFINSIGTGSTGGGGISGSGSTNYLPKFINSTTLGDSLISEVAGKITIGSDALINGLTVGRGSGGSDNTAIGGSALNNNTTGSNNTAIGYLSLYNNTTGYSNTAIGYRNLYSNISGSANVAIGNFSLYSNTTGANNTSNGHYSLYSNTTGYSNTAIGGSALYNNTTGYSNTAIGYESLHANTTAGDSTAIGYQSLRNNITGYGNTSVGYLTLYTNTTGYNNTAIGNQSLYSNITGYSNTANGYRSLYNNTTGYSNTAIGYQSLYSNTTGRNNTSNGHYSIYSNTTGSSNTVIGYASLFKNTTGSNNIAIGGNAGNDIAGGDSNLISNNSIYIGNNTSANANNQTNQIVIGHEAVGVGSNSVVIGNDSIIKTVLKGIVTIGSDALINGLTVGRGGGYIYSNSSFGYQSLYSNTTGNNNTGVGYESLQNNTTGSNNTATGSGSLKSNTIGIYNTAFGYNSLYNNTTGGGNTAFGSFVLNSNSTGQNNNAFGSSVLSSNNGNYNNGFGSYVLDSNTNGISNNAFGTSTLTSNTTGSYNDVFGASALRHSTTGSYNVAFGMNAGRLIAAGGNNILTNSSIYIGGESRAELNNQTNQIVIGHGAIGVGSNTVVLGNNLIIKTVLKGSVFAALTLELNNKIADYILTLPDRGKMIELDVASANTLTVPTNSSVAFPIGTQIRVYQMGAGQTTITAAGGVTIRQRQGYLKLAGQYAIANLIKRDVDEWVLSGDLST